MRKDLEKMSKVIAQIKNPNFPPAPTEVEMQRSTTGVDLNIPNKGIVIDKDIATNIREQQEVDKLTSSHIYGMGHSTNKKYENATPAEKRSMIINREYDRP